MFAAGEISSRVPTTEAPAMTAQLLGPLSTILGTASIPGTAREVGGIAARARRRPGPMPLLVALALCVAPGLGRADTIALNTPVDTPTDFSFTAVHGFIANGSTFHAFGKGNNWVTGGGAQDLSGGVVLPDRVDIALSVQHAVRPDVETQQGIVIAFPVKRISASGLGNSVGNVIAAVGLTASHPTGPHFDNVIYNGSFSTSSGGLFANSISSYNIVVTADHSSTSRFALATVLAGAQEPTPVNTAAYGSMNGFVHTDTDTFNLTMALVNLQKSGITDVVIGSNSAGFVPVHLGSSFLADTTADATSGVVGGGSFIIPAADLDALSAGNAFVNVLTSANPSGEVLGGLSVVPLTTVPEPSSLSLLAACCVGVLGHGLRRGRSIARGATRRR
jgi:hypothetical protein